jgi:hypothetical protein
MRSGLQFWIALTSLAFVSGTAPSKSSSVNSSVRQLSQTNFVSVLSLYGDNEELLGRWFKRTGKREDIFLATKFGFVKGSKTAEVDSSAEYCKKACAESLRLLGVDVIDLCESGVELFTAMEISFTKLSARLVA